MSAPRHLTEAVALGVSAALVFSAASGRAAQTAPDVDGLIAQMTLPEKIAMLYGATDPEHYGQAGYLPGVPRLGIPALRLTDGPAGVRTAQPATALPAPVALAATFSPDLAQSYGQVIGRDGRARHQNVILAPMVNIVRVPQGGRNFETLGEDPFLASRMVAAEVIGIQREGVIATVKHFALNNQENQRQSVSADVDEQTMHEIELPGFEGAVRAGVGAVMAAYNKVNGTYAAENPVLLGDVLRKTWGFNGFVMSDWGAAHSGDPSLTAGLDLEMPSGRNYASLGDAVASGQVSESAVNQAVRRILSSMQAAGLLAPVADARPAGEIPDASPVARDIAIAGAVLLKNDRQILPLSKTEDVAIIGPTARVLLVGGGGSARVPPMHAGSPFDALRQRAPTARLTYAIGDDVEGTTVPASALTLHRTRSTGGDAVVDPIVAFEGAAALAAGTSWTWTGTITAPATGDYMLKLQITGGRGSIAFEPPAAAGAPGGATGRGGRGGGRGAGATALLSTHDGFTNTNAPVHLEAGVAHPLTVTASANDTAPLQIRLAWLTPTSAADALAEAVRAGKAAHTVVVFAYDESQEGRDRASLSLPDNQDALIAAVAAVNPRTIVVLNNGAPILMPWADDVAAILQMWYPGQEGAEATAALLVGDASPGGRLPVTFPKRLEDAPTNPPDRYPGVNGHSAYSEGIYVGYRWYDQQQIAPLFAFGYGLSYTRFEYSALTVAPRGDGFDVTFDVRNTGTREGTDVPQVYVGRPAATPAPMAERQLVGFSRLTLSPGKAGRVTIHVGARELSYWSIVDHDWRVAVGQRTLLVGASSRDIRLKADVTVK